MKPDQKGNFGVLAIFTVILLVALTGASVYFWQNYEKEKALKTVEVKTEEKTEEKTETPTPAPTPTPAEESKAPVVVFTPNGLFTAEERAELQTKFINPFLVNISVSLETHANFFDTLIFLLRNRLYLKQSLRNATSLMPMNHLVV